MQNKYESLTFNRFNCKPMKLSLLLSEQLPGPHKLQSPFRLEHKLIALLLRSIGRHRYMLHREKRLHYLIMKASSLGLLYLRRAKECSFPGLKQIQRKLDILFALNFHECVFPRLDWNEIKRG